MSYCILAVPLAIRCEIGTRPSATAATAIAIAAISIQYHIFTPSSTLINNPGQTRLAVPTNASKSMLSGRPMPLCFLAASRRHLPCIMHLRCKHTILWCLQFVWASSRCSVFQILRSRERYVRYIRCLVSKYNCNVLSAMCMRF